MFHAKYGPSGQLLWATRAGGNGPNSSIELYDLRVVVDEAGNSYVAGNFSDTATFGEGETHATTLSMGNSYRRLFVAKYDSAGQLLWARQDTQGSISVGMIALDPMGDLSVIGGFSSSQTFGMGEPHETTLHPNGRNLFVAKYASSGTLLWAKKTGGGGYEVWRLAVAMDSAENLYVTGSFYPCTVTFGDDNAHYVTLTNHYKKKGVCVSGDIFVAKFRGDFPVGELPTVVLANTAVSLDRPGVSEGAIWSNGTLQFLPGAAATSSILTTHLTAVQDISIGPGNTIVGTATAGGLVNVLPGAMVTEEIMADAPVTPQPLPSPTFTAGGADQTVPPQGLLSLAPGAYGQVTVGPGGTLQLHSGAYFLRTLSLGTGARLVVDMTDGPVQLNVVTKLVIGKQVRVSLTPADADSTLLRITTLQTKRLSIGNRAQIVGTLLAPHAMVVLGSGSQFTGMLMADQVTVQSGAVLLPHESASSVP